MQKTWIRSLDWADTLEKGKATHSSILAWRIPWTVNSPWRRKESDKIEKLSLFLAVQKLLSLSPSHLFIFTFISIILRDRLKKILL